jgi:hypothetical protein
MPASRRWNLHRKPVSLLQIGTQRMQVTPEPDQSFTADILMPLTLFMRLACETAVFCVLQ